MPSIPSALDEHLEPKKLNPKMPDPPTIDTRISLLDLFEWLQGHICRMNTANGFWDDPEEVQKLRTFMSTESGRMLPHDFRVALDTLLGRDWHNHGEKLALMHSELSEGLEADRKDLPSDKIPFKGIEEELADCMIRIFDYAGKYRLSLGEAFLAKLDYNAKREYKHGKKY